jgi:hypothetical protein
VTYEAGICPNAEETVGQMVTLTVHEFYTEDDVADMAAAIQKVAAAAQKR